MKKKHGTLELHLGDCVEVLKSLPSNSIHSIVTDPPYGISLDGSKWDNFGTNIKFSMWCREWASECRRVLRPGGYIISFSAPRTYHRMVCGIEDAGFNIKDTINWIYFSGMPKSLHYGKKDKRLTGWSSSLKPCFEPAVLAQKPLKEKNITTQLLKSRTGALNIDACRFKFGDPCWLGSQKDHSSAWDRPVTSNLVSGGNMINATSYKKVDLRSYKPKGGRWPANIYHCLKPSKKEKNIGLEFTEGMNENPHPTVKPLKLISWCIKLVTAEGGTVLDPFMGSGTTAIAAVTNGFNCIGIEKNPLYHSIIERRISWINRESIT